jgi:NADPH:quinone reductase-like Zn-dependent oxidoreductase
MSHPSTTKAFTVGSIRSPPDITITSRPIPNPPAPGTCCVRVLSAYASPGWPLFFDGTLSYLSFPLPFVPGSQAVGRVLSTGPDASLLRPGDLVFIDSFVRARDDPVNTQILLGLHQGSTDASKRLMREGWPDGVLRTVATVPLENVHRLDEAAIDKLGYTPSELVIALSRLVVAAGGIAAADLRPGQTVIVGPATGHVSTLLLPCPTICFSNSCLSTPAPSQKWPSL